jgi:all-trans-retinol dehydrogenase (NAD+)
MIERRRGSIIGICSFLGLTTIPYSAAYSSTKFGVNGFYKSLLDDLSVKDQDRYINVSCLCPGFFRSSDVFSELVNEAQLPFQLSTLSSIADSVIDAILKRIKFKIFPDFYKAAVLTK